MSCQPIQNFIDGLGRQILIINVIGHHHGRAGAGSQTFLFALQENPPVRRAFARLDSQFLLDVIAPRNMQEMLVHTDT